MKAKITLLARINRSFTAVEFRKSNPLATQGASSYYARYTAPDGKRVTKPLGKDFTQAVVDFRNMELAREFTVRGLPVPEITPAVRVAAGGPSITTQIDKYLEEVRANKSPKTYTTYKRSMDLFTAFIEKNHIAELTRERMLNFKTFLHGKGFGKRTIFSDFLNAMIFLKWADIKVPIKKDDWPPKWEREPEEYTDEELVALLEAANNWERLLFECLVCSGLRTGELAHLTYGDIDFKHSAFTVQPKEDWNTKTRHAQRDVPVPTWLIDKLRERMTSGCRRKTDLVFFNTNGGPLVNGTMLDITKRVAKRAGLTGRVDDHKFRSTAITRWLRTPGVTVPDVMGWVGHVDTKTILRYAAKMKVRSPEMHSKATSAFAHFDGVGD